MMRSTSIRLNIQHGRGNRQTQRYLCIAAMGTSVDPGVCDGIFINTGVTHPQPKWLDSLRVGGSLVLPLTVAMGMGMGENLGKGVVTKINREPNGFSARVTSFVAIYSCVSMRDPQIEQALGKAMASGKLFRLRSLRRDAHEPADNCVLHGRDFCLTSAELGARVAA
jgi:hypothetical protein